MPTREGVWRGRGRAGMVIEWSVRLLSWGMALRRSATLWDISRWESRSLRLEAAYTGEGDLILLLPLYPSPGSPTYSTDSQSEENSTVCPDTLIITALNSNNFSVLH